VNCTPSADEAIEHHHRAPCRHSRSITGYCLEHPRPHAERCDCVSNPAARKSIHNSNYSLRLEEESVVRNPTGERNCRNCRIPNVMKCCSCSPHAGRTIFARRNKAQSRLPWHYIDYPFKPEAKPASIKAIQPPHENILTAIVMNERIMRSGSDPARRGVALAWLFHLVGDIHQPLHAVQLFTREYPKGDRGGGDFCVRVTQDRAALSLHRLWDGLITSSNNIRTLRTIASDYRAAFPSPAFQSLP